MSIHCLYKLKKTKSIASALRYLEKKMMYQLPNIINSRINYGTIISTITVAQTVVCWLPTRVSGVQIPQMLVGAEGGNFLAP